MKPKKYPLGTVVYEKPQENEISPAARRRPRRGTLQRLLNLAKAKPRVWAVAIYGDGVAGASSGLGVINYARNKYGSLGFEFTQRDYGNRIYCRFNPEACRRGRTKTREKL